jgi:transcriptional regulator with XRE-family HTH domain
VLNRPATSTYTSARYRNTGLRTARGYSQEGFAQKARLNRAYMGGVERGQRNVGVVNLYRIAQALDMSLSELFAEVESEEGQEGG